MTIIHRIIAYLLKLLGRLSKEKKTDVQTKTVRLVTSDGYIITDANGTLIMIKMEDK